MDACDGYQTRVEWAPKFLIVPKHTAVDYHTIHSTRKAGLYYYEPRPEMAWCLEKVRKELDTFIGMVA